MKITYYKECRDESVKLASFGVRIPEWRLEINNLSVIKAKNGGFFITLPTFKDKESVQWDKVVSFDPDTYKKFMKAVEEAVKDYAEVKGFKIS